MRRGQDCCCNCCSKLAKRHVDSVWRPLIIGSGISSAFALHYLYMA
jgi:hypothetical protein